MVLAIHNPDTSETSLLSNEEKVAIVLSRLNPVIVQNLLGKISKNQAERIKQTLEKITTQPPAPDALQQVLAEFNDRVNSRKKRTEAGGITLYQPAPRDEPTAIIEVPTPVIEVEAPRPIAPPKPEPAVPALPAPKIDVNEEIVDNELVSKLRAWDSDLLASALNGEQPIVVACVLSCMEPMQAANLLRRLPDKVGQQAFLTMQTVNLKGDLITKIVRSVLEKSRSLNSDPMTAVEQQDELTKVKRMAVMLRGLSASARQELLKTLEERTPETAKLLQEHLYTFDDLLNLDDLSIQKLLSKIATQVLALALTTAAGNIKDKTLRNMSKRAREGIYEEMASGKAAAPAKVNEAQKTIVKEILRMDGAGELEWLT